MNLVYCIPSTYASGGMERILTLKANFFARRGDTVTIITSSQKGRPHFYDLDPAIKHLDIDIDYEEIAKLPLHKRISQRLKAKKLHRKRLEDLLMQIRPDITVSMFTHELTFLPDIKDGSKKVLELHFSKSYRKLDADSKGISPIFKLINHLLDASDRKVIKKFDKFVVLTHRDAADWGDSYPNIEVIPNPSSFVPDQLTDHKSKRVLSVGRLCPQKGFDMLVEAWSKIPETTRSGWTLDIIGSGPDEEKLRNLIVSHHLSDSINLLPPTSDIKSQYLSHSIYCLPSRYEGFPLVLLEAASFGLTPIALDCPCGPSDLISDKVNGLLIPINDIENLAKALAELMSDTSLRQKYGVNAAQTITDDFSQKSVMNKWEKLFDSLL